jgi:4-nitrophenyl phosphatase
MLTFPPIRALILDMDGVIWRGSQPIGDLPAIFDRFSRLGCRVTLATNNATLSIAQYQDKLAGLGLHLEAWQIVNSSHATGRFLQTQFPQGGRVHVVGELGLIQTLAEYNFHPADEDVLAVVVGLDRQLTYDTLTQAALLIRAGALFVGTNPDRTYPAPNGQVPGAGAILAALQAATDVEPVIVGKPSPEMYRLALDRLGVPASETLVVGDRLETDIAGAQAIGCRTALVLSGVSTAAQASAWKPAPDWVLPDLTAVAAMLQESPA